MDPEGFERAFALLEKAPRHFQELLRPLVIRASQEAQFMPFVEHLFNDAFTLHLLAGGEPEPFLPTDETQGKRQQEAYAARHETRLPPTDVVWGIWDRFEGLQVAVAEGAKACEVVDRVSRVQEMLRLARVSNVPQPVRFGLGYVFDALSFTPTAELTLTKLVAVSLVLTHLISDPPRSPVITDELLDYIRDTLDTAGFELFPSERTPSPAFEMARALAKQELQGLEAAVARVREAQTCTAFEVQKDRAGRVTRLGKVWLRESAVKDAVRTTLLAFAQGSLSIYEIEPAIFEKLGKL